MGRWTDLYGVKDVERRQALVGLEQLLGHGPNRRRLVRGLQMGLDCFGAGVVHTGEPCGGDHQWRIWVDGHFTRLNEILIL